MRLDGVRRSVFHSRRPGAGNIIINMPCVKCGGRPSGDKPTHIARSCKSSTELRPQCFCSLFPAVITWCGKYVTPTEWARGLRIHNACKNADHPAIVARVGTQISCTGSRPLLLKSRSKPKPGTGAARDAARDRARARGEPRRNAEGGESGPNGQRQDAAAALDKMDAADREAILAASIVKRDKRECLERAVVLWRRVDAKSPIRNMLRARRPNPFGRTQREKDGDPQTLQTTRAVDSLLWLLKMVQLGLIFYCWDVENQFPDDRFRHIRDHGEGLAAAYLAKCWESCLSKAVCKPKAPVTRVGYAVVDEKDLKWKRVLSRNGGRFKVVVSGSLLSRSRQTAVVAKRDVLLPVAIQKGPEVQMGPLLGVKLLWDIFAAFSRAAGHENGGAHNDLITMPFSSNSLALLFSRTFKHRAEPDVADEIWSVQELGTALYWLLRDDPLCSVDDIVNARFPGRDPTKWDFSSFDRSADATPSKKRKRAIDLTADESEDECEDEYASDYESDDE